MSARVEELRARLQRAHLAGNESEFTELRTELHALVAQQKAEQRELLLASPDRRDPDLLYFFEGHPPKEGPVEALDEMLDICVNSPKLLQVAMRNGETGEVMTCRLKADSNYVMIERSMLVELILRTIERHRVGEMEVV